MTLDVRIDRDLCLGTANCEFWAPHTFAVDHESRATVIDAAGDPDDDIVRAATMCPTHAITVLRDGAVVAP